MKRIKKLMLIMVTFAFVLAGMVSVAGAEEVSGGENNPWATEGEPGEPEEPGEPGEPEELEGTEGLEGTGGPEIKPEGPEEPEEPEEPKGAGIEGDGSQENPWLIKSWDNLTAVIEEKQGGWLLLNNDIDGESNDLVIPDDVSVTIDLNGHTLDCLDIGFGEEKASALRIVSSVTGGKLVVSDYIWGAGNLGFENCEVSAKAIDGSEGSVTLKGASVKLGVEAEEVGGFLWGGSEIKLSNNSTMDLNGWNAQTDEAAKIDIEAGSKITGIPFIMAYSWENETRDNLKTFIANIEGYAVAAGFTLDTNEDNVIIFLDNERKQVESGSLLGVTVLNENSLNVSLGDEKYDGAAKNPKVTVEGRELDSDDYDVTYKDAGGNEVAEPKDAGTYTITITGKGSYTGTTIQAITIEQAKPKYVPSTEPIDGTMNQKDQEESLGSPKGVNNQELSGTWKWSDNAEYLRAGKKKYPVTFNPDDANYTSITSDVVVSTWGAEKNNGTAENPIYNYVAKNGTTSAEVTGNSIIWLKEESEGLSIWYGVENSKATFAEGSKFWVRWLSISEDSKEWKDYYEKLDDEYKKLAENKKLWIFLMGVANPDGEEYHGGFDSPVDLYIQLGTDWDMDDINAVFISDASDEVLSVQTLNNYTLPDGTKAMVSKVGLRHFSPYAIMEISLPDPSPETGDSSRILLWILLAVLSCGAMTCAAVYKRKHRQA